jgi:hypothetical protein
MVNYPPLPDKLIGTRARCKSAVGRVALFAEDQPRKVARPAPCRDVSKKAFGAARVAL